MPSTGRPEPTRWLVFIGLGVVLTPKTYKTAEKVIEDVRRSLGDRCSHLSMNARPATVEDIEHFHQLMELSR